MIARKNDFIFKNPYFANASVFQKKQIEIDNKLSYKTSVKCKADSVKKRPRNQGEIR